MSSNALQTWTTTRAAALDEIEGAHRLVGGTGAGRRLALQQVNQAYVVLLSSHFQGFCRDLHTECVDCLVKAVTAAAVRALFRSELTLNRKLERGNPTPGNIGADFNRLGLSLWTCVETLDARNRQNKASLEELNEWRNAIAHQDFDPARLGGMTQVRISAVRGWRGACNALATAFDAVMYAPMLSLTGIAPW